MREYKMKNRKRIVMLFLALLPTGLMVCGAATGGQKDGTDKLTVRVSNPDRMQRQEVMGVDVMQVYTSLGAKAGTPLVVWNALGQEVASQVTYDGLLLMDASVRPLGTAEFTVSVGQPSPYESVCTGRQYPERVDDIAWENDRTAYRIYGPALQRNKERAFGVDVWVKNTPELEVEKRYNTELSNHPRIEQLKAEGKNDEAVLVEQLTTYHYDHGRGLDCYKVGPSLGGGAPALMNGEQLILPYCYRDYEICDNGPLRFTVHVTYHPTTINGQGGVVEHRIISLDKGSNFNRCTVWYEGLQKTERLAMGIVVHEEEQNDLLTAQDMVLYADPTDNPAKQNFQIYVGVLFPEGVAETCKLMNKTPENGIAGHAVGITDYEPGTRYTYYFGSAWSKNDVRTFNEWRLRAEETLHALKEPLRIEH